MMYGFFSPIYDYLAGVLRKQQGQLAYDTIDRVNAWFTPFVLIAMTLAISCKQYFGQPIKCWTPREFSGSWDAYVHDVCFIENTYFVPNGTEITDEARGARHINYYRWVPLVLLLQAALFVIPYNVWNLLHKRTTINLKGSLRFFEEVIKKQEPAQACEMFAGEIWNKLLAIRDSTIKRHGRQATIYYFCLKFAYLIICCLQLCILMYFLDVSDILWGFKHFLNVDFAGTSEREDSIFPRIVLCDFNVRNLGQSHKHTLSCIIILNMIIEKLYICFYFWIIFLFIFTLVGMSYFAIQIVFRRHSLIPTNLNNKPLMNPTRSQTFMQLLRSDGILLLTYVDAQFGAYRTSQVIDGLLNRFLNEKQPDSSTTTTLHDDQIGRDGATSYENNDTMRVGVTTQSINEVDGSSTRQTIQSEKKDI